jgi:hypothetical protein
MELLLRFKRSFLKVGIWCNCKINDVFTPKLDTVTKGLDRALYRFVTTDFEGVCTVTVIGRDDWVIVVLLLCVY